MHLLHENPFSSAGVPSLSLKKSIVSVVLLKHKIKFYSIYFDFILLNHSIACISVTFWTSDPTILLNRVEITWAQCQ